MQSSAIQDFISDYTIRKLIDGLVESDPDHVLCHFENRAYTIRELSEKADRLASALLDTGIEAGQRVLVMLPQHIDHVITIFAMLRTGIIWVPINIHSKGDALAFLAGHADPAAAIVDATYRDTFERLLETQSIPLVIWRDGGTSKLSFEQMLNTPPTRNALPSPAPDDVLCLSYSSGTTGEPKGSLVTDRALRASAGTCIHVAGMEAGDVMLLWEPLHHLAGGQVPLIALLKKATFALVRNFSASRFWSDAKLYNVTHIHYLGGVLPILLKQPPSPAESDHRVRIAWGGGCPAQVWHAAEARFGVTIREGYGLTEVTSFVTANRTGREGSIGQAISPFNVYIVDEAGRPVGDNVTGEIVVRPEFPGLTSKGYFRNPEASAAMTRDGQFFSGDLGYRDKDGYFYFVGRKKDSVRRRGENISAWEVERVINQHPCVEESALIGVPSDVGEDDLKIFIRTTAGATLQPEDLIRWCEDKMPYFQIPRYVTFVDDFPRTPTHRIRKPDLPRSLNDCWDLDASGYKLRRNAKPTSEKRAEPTAQQRETKISFRGVQKCYGNSTVLAPTDLDIRAGEFLTLLGPSGSGKTTLLNILAGITEPSDGELWIDGRNVTNLSSGQRGIGMVFQNYALMPHLTVFENVAFPLRIRRMAKAEIRSRVERALSLVDMEQFADRRPKQLSGGQQQRVSIARCLVYEPSIILMDEPLGALDKKLRTQLQIEIKRLHDRLGFTALYVTHDQDEAMSMSDRICLMDAGRIVQIDSPKDLYFRPRSQFAANFLGEANLLEVKFVGQRNRARFEGLGGETLYLPPSTDAAIDSNHLLLLRPENVRILDERSDADNVVSATVDDVIFFGGQTRISASINGHSIVAKQPTGTDEIDLKPGDGVRLGWANEAMKIISDRT
ncbi:AMP-binding protein [Paraburkholderia sp.]|uniref:AMP-binding protein n=1 Tax=Paraburkholderia sp. TaxID=1926495 RepID=UPI0039E247B8